MRLVHHARISLCLLAIAAAAAGLAEAATLYGSAYSGPDGLADLYTIDPATGADTLVGPIKFQRVSSLDFGPDGRLYGVGERNDASNTVVLLVIDTVTGLGTEVGPLGVAASRAVTDISFRQSDGLLYAHLMNPQEIATIDHATGAASVLGPTGVFGGGNAIAFSRGLVLYFVRTSSPDTFVHTLNQASGAASPGLVATYAGFPPPASLFVINAMDAEPSSGVMYVSVNDSLGGAGVEYLALLDPVSGVVRHIGLSVPGLDALAWEPDRCKVALYGAAHSGGPSTPSRLFSIDMNTGAATAIGPINFNAVGGIDVNPITGIMYGVGHRPVVGTQVLIAIDPTTGAGTEVGPLVNTVGGLFDLSFRSDGRLFLAAFDLGGFQTLFVVDQTTGLATPLGGTATTGGGNALGHNLSDSLYYATTFIPNHQIYTLDQSTGAGTFLTSFGYSGFPPLATPRLNAMDTDPSTGAAWAVVNDGTGGGGPNYIATLDPRRGNVRHVGLTAAGMDALAFAVFCDEGDPCTFDECVRCEDAGLLGAAFAGPNGLADLMRIDPTSGATALIGPIGFERVSGMDFDRETGVLYATGERADGTNTNVLIAIDPATGAGNEIGPTGLPFPGPLVAESDISIRHSDGTIYAYLEPNDGVATIDRVTGAATFLGFSGISGGGNGVAFSEGDVLFHADHVNVHTLDQTTGAATLGPAISWSGFPPPTGVFRVVAIDTNCNGRFFVAVKDAFGPGGGPTYLGVLDTSSGTVAHIGTTEPRLDALAWTGIRGFCRNTFVDSDADTVCDALDCADFDPSAWAVPPEITDDTFPNPGTYTWGSLAPISGPGTVYDLVADPVTALPVGPVEGLGVLCNIPHVPIVVGNPPLGTIWWLAVRGRNVCGLGTYGDEQQNNLPPFPLFVPRTTASCP